MKIQSKKAAGNAFFVHAVDEREAIYELQRQNPESLSISEYHVSRIRRTFWQRFTNSPPRWKVTYTVDAKQAESGTR